MSIPNIKRGSTNCPHSPPLQNEDNHPTAREERLLPGCSGDQLGLCGQVDGLGVTNKDTYVQTTGDVRWL